MADKYQALREAAKRATPGKWMARIQDSRLDGDRCYADVYPSAHIKGFSGAVAGQKSNRKNSQWQQRADNIRYIAAANPATIQALLAEREALREALDGIRQYGSDTLSGRADGGVDDRAWQRDAVLEMTKRARIALTE